ncbi:MAG: hypothetical protein A2902_00935 [Elusimicrobia bacterium RIFCSPLOWO2_01_FULL_64_13]|nr:MAG: hypothetical protein A2636_01265 [Elusimicrobia bacterium RIFCSPHIGHO2_01_FULL_64_10]OGR97866.1 MAG: hypothetical protein A2902_00935 [Elusimicrobia bacterium RIFCSPLOWO2_01_FULL_64_13]
MNRICLNGAILPESRAKVSAMDRGFLYGDGAYEAVRVYRGRIFRADRHWRRLSRSLAALRIRVPWNGARLTKLCLATARANGLADALVRATITRGKSPLGYDPRSAKKPTLAIAASPIRNDLPELWRRGVAAAVVKIRRNPPASLDPAVKHTNSLNGILAKMESLEAGAFEGIFLNLDGFVAEGTISNLFAVRDGRLRTPSLDSGILDGVTRRAVLEIARRARIPCREARMRPEEIFRADEIFLTSTTMEVMPVVRVGRRRIGPGVPGPVTRSLQTLFRELVNKELGLGNPARG